MYERIHNEKYAYGNGYLLQFRFFIGILTFVGYSILKPSL